MRITLKTVLMLSGAAAGLVLSGCARFEARSSAPAPITNGGQAAQATSGSQFGPAYATVVEGGVLYTKSSMAFPTGQRESSGLLLEKMVPVEVLVGQPFEYRYRVSNLTDHPLQMVTVFDHTTGSFTRAAAEPPPTDTREGVATWQLGTLGSKESKLLRITGSGKEEGALNSCGWASFSPVMCEDIKVTKPNIQLSAKAPAEALLCDPIPVTLSVKNTGSSTLTGVRVVETLPEGLVSDGKNSLTFEAGTLASGQSRDFSFNVAAAKAGKFIKSAKVTSLQGGQAEAASETIVREPVLTLSGAAPPERYLGRPFEVVFTIGNKGDTNATDTVLEVPLATGLTLKSATEGGRLAGNKMVWDLGSMAADASRQVGGTFVSANAGLFEFKGTVKGYCAQPVESACQTRVVGVAALLLEKADNPDPVEVGESTTYTVKVTNQGTAESVNVRMVVMLPEELTPVSATGECTVEGQKVSFPVVTSLAPKAAVSYQIVAKGAKVGDGRTRFTLTADGLKAPVVAEESTTVY